MSVRRRAVMCAQLCCLVSFGVPRVMAQAENANLHGRMVTARMSAQDSAHVQQPGVATDERITLDLHDVALKDALRAIAQQGHVALFYNDRDLPTELRVSLVVADATVTQALRIVLRGTGLAVRATAGGILLEQRAPTRRDQEPREQQGTIRGVITDSTTGAPVGGATVAVNGGEPRTASDAHGAYRLARVPVGSVTLIVRRLGYVAVSRKATVVADSETVVDVRLVPAPRMLDEVVTTGTVVPTEVKALPTPITVVTADQIARRHPLTLAAVLRQVVPTAVAFDSPNTPANTDISVRGASSLNSTGSDMKIFIDGVEATRFSFASVDVTSIDRIEVIRGPEAATIYGADAASGVIQIFTKRGDSTLARPHVDARMALGMSQTPYAGFHSVPRQQYDGSVHGGEHDASYNFGGSYTHFADYAPSNGATRQSARSAFGGMHYSRNVFTADVSARYYDNEVPIVLNPLFVETGYAAGAPPLYTHSSYTNETVGTRVTVTPVTWWRNQLTLGVDRFQLRSVQTQSRRTTAGDTLLSLQDERFRKLSIGYNTTLIGTLNPSLGSSLTLGIDHYTQDVSNFSTSQALNTSGTIQTVPPGSFNESLNTITNTGYFAQAQVSIWNALFFTGGVRAERNTTFGADYGTAVLPRLGVSFVQPIGAVTAKIRASYGQALRTPQPGEASSVTTAGATQLANPALKPERQDGWDGGVDLVFSNRGSLSVTAFNQIAKQLISFLLLSATTSQYQNIGRVSNKGLEVEGTLALVPWLQLRGQYGYVRSRVEAVGAAGGQVQVGDETLGVPTHTAGLSVTATPSEGTTLSLGATYVGSWRQADFLATYRCLATFTADVCPASFLSTFSLRPFTIAYPGFAKVNATVAHRFTQQLEAFVSIDNLTNNESYEFANSSPVMGRTTMLGIHVSY